MKRVLDRLIAVSATGRRSRRRHVAALGALVLPAAAAAAEPVFGDLPADIVKERPSASVPADLPESRADPCAIYAGVRVFVPLRRGVLVDADPAALAGDGGNGCAETSAASPPTHFGGEQPFVDAGE